MKMYKRPLILVLCIMLAFGSASVRPAAAADPYEINVVMGLTGRYAFVGAGVQRGMQAYADAINKRGGLAGRPIKLVIQDDQSNPQVALQLINGLIAKKVQLILGPSGVANCAALAPVISSGPVLYCLSPAFEAPSGSYMFEIGVSDIDGEIAQMRFLRNRGLKRVAFLTSTDGTGQTIDSGTAAALAMPEFKDMVAVDREHFGPTDVSITAEVSRIKAAKPQALLVGATGSPAGTVLRSIQEVGLDIPVLIPQSNATVAQMKQYADFLPKELYFPNQPYTAPDNVTDKDLKTELDVYFAAMNAAGIKPDIEAVGWDALLVTVAVLRKTGLNATAEQIRATWASVQGLAGVAGRYDYKAKPQRGLGISSVSIQQWEPAKGTWVAVSAPGGGQLKK